MEVEQNKITLHSSDVFYPHSMRDAFRVEDGAVYVYIVPLTKNKEGKAQAGKRQFLCQIRCGERMRTIPGFSYRDRDYRSWCFAIVPSSEQAVLTAFPGGVTSVLQRNFLKAAGIGTYAQEGFADSLVDFYNRELLKGHVVITKGSRSDERAREDTVNVLKGTFRSGPEVERQGSPAFQAMQYLCARQRIPLPKPEEITARCGRNPDVPAIARAAHCICRRVVLDAQWYRSDCGPLIGMLDQEIIACVPEHGGRYTVFRTATGKTEPLTRELAHRIDPEAYSIGRTLPLRPLTWKDVTRFCAGSISARDLVPYAVLTLVCALIGVLLPTLNQLIYDEYIPVGSYSSLAQICIILLTFMIGNVAFSIVQSLFGFRVVSKVRSELQAAVFHRLYHLPESFFREYDSADLGSRVLQIGSVIAEFANTIVLTGISALLGVVYLVRMGSYSGRLTWIGAGMYLAYILVMILLTLLAQPGEKQAAAASAEADSKLYQYLNGVDKIRMAGVEKQAILSYMRPFARKQNAGLRAGRILTVKQTLAGISAAVFSMVLYLVIVRNQIELSVGAFVAFHAAFGAFTGAMNALVEEAVGLLRRRVAVERFRPVFTTAPEDDGTGETPGELTGAIDLEHVSFRYSSGSRNVLEDLSLHIRPGEYVGIVGASGCGKSTLLKLLLGFETPASGMVLADGKDLSTLDKSAYRRQLGVVLQNGKLISGSIFENITITAPEASMERVREVVEQVGLKEDIDAMPMGLHTMLSESGNTISGGQAQRILIARAIVGSPRLLIFDEATSALDNLTQAMVCRSLDQMQVTRIVVAHRLSTIRSCDRILVLENGRIAEEGTYDSLMERHGLFYTLASRQIAEM